MSDRRLMILVSFAFVAASATALGIADTPVVVSLAIEFVVGALAATAVMQHRALGRARAVFEEISHRAERVNALTRASNVTIVVPADTLPGGWVLVGDEGPERVLFEVTPETYAALVKRYGPGVTVEQGLVTLLAAADLDGEWRG